MQGTVWFVLALLLGLLLVVCLIRMGTMAAGYRSRMRTLDPGGREMYVSYETPDYPESAGFRVEKLPETGILIPQVYWLVNGCIAEIEYNIVPTQRAWLRLAKSGALHCADAYADMAFDSTSEYELDGIRITQQQMTGGFVCIRWSRNGFDFMFYAPEAQMNALNGMVETIVKEISVSDTAA